MTTNLSSIGKINKIAKKITRALLPRANNELVSNVASALVIKDLTTKGSATNIPNNGVNNVQNAQRCQTHQYQIVADGLINMLNAQNNL